MSDFYIERAELEKCPLDKKPVTLIHSKTAIHYIISGKGYLDGQKLCAGQGFVCLRNQHYNYYPDKDDPWTYFWIRITGDHEKVFELFDSVGLKKYPCVFNFDWEEKILKFVHEYFTDGIYVTENEMHSEGLIKLILSEHLNSEENENRMSRREMHIKKAKAFIQNNIQNRITAEEVASSLFLSRAYLRNIFTEYVGIPPKKYIIDMKVERAKELLRIKRLSVTDIANSVGYDDALLFSRVFKSHAGVSPLEYRKCFLSDEQDSDTDI